MPSLFSTVVVVVPSGFSTFVDDVCSNATGVDADANAVDDACADIAGSPPTFSPTGVDPCTLAGTVDPCNPSDVDDVGCAIAFDDDPCPVASGFADDPCPVASAFVDDPCPDFAGSPTPFSPTAVDANAVDDVGNPSAVDDVGNPSAVDDPCPVASGFADVGCAIAFDDDPCADDPCATCGVRGGVPSGVCIAVVVVVVVPSGFTTVVVVVPS